MSEIKMYTAEELKAYAANNTIVGGGVTLPSGNYRVEKLELREEAIQEDKPKAKWVDVHLVNTDPKKNGLSGKISASRFATRGFAKTPVLGRVKNKYYFPTENIGCVYQGAMADLLEKIQGKEISVTAENGFVPNFTLGSWATKEEAVKAAEPGFATKQFLKITAISENPVM